MRRRLVVEADGGSRGNPGPAGYGALVRDRATGEVLDEAAAAIGRATNNVAEYSGLLAGLRAAAAVDPEAAVEVRMDSKLVVEQMSGRWQVKHEDMRRLARQAKEVFPAGRVTYTWVPRKDNAAADRLANEAMDAAAAGRTWERRGTAPDEAAEPAGLPRTEPAYGTSLGSITQASQCCPARYCHRFGPYNAIDVVDTGRHGPSGLPVPVPVPVPSGSPEPG